MTRILITGATGFVGPYVAAALRESPLRSADICATALRAQEHSILGRVVALDVTDSVAVRSAISDFHPTHVVHLAGMSFVPEAGKDPAMAWDIHVRGTLNVAHAIQSQVPDCSLLFVGSGRVYGASARHGEPLDEDSLLAPMDDYSVTKAAADLALGAMAANGLKVIRIRPFNHTGPGQRQDFLVPSIAMQIARIEVGHQPPVISVGNLDVARDFLDVRDVARAYALASQHAGRLEPGTILNVASGRAVTVREILDRLLLMTSGRIEVVQDPALMRSGDYPCIVGDARKAETLIDWRPSIALDQTLADVLAYCRKMVAQPCESA